MGEGGVLAADRTREVAVEVGDRRLQAGGAVLEYPPAGQRFVHPGAAALGLARVEVEVELANEGAVRGRDAEEAHVLVPHRCVVRFDAHAVERLDGAEQAGEDLGLGEILLHLLLGEGVAGLQQLFRNVGDVPGFKCFELQGLARVGAQGGDVLFGEGLGLAREIVEEGADLCDRFGHLRHQRDFGKAGVAEQPGFFVAQRQDLTDQRGVVERLRAEFRSPRRRGAVKRLAQAAAVGVLQHRQVGRHVQGELPAGFAILLGRFARGFDGVGRQASKLGGVADVFGKGIGGVEQVFGELGAECGEFFLDGLEARFLRFRKFGAGEPEVANLVVEDALARGAERGVFRAGAQRLVAGEEGEVLSQFGVKTRNLGQHGVVGLAPGRDVEHRVQVADDAPGARQALHAVGQRRGEVVPARRCRIRVRGGQALDQRTAFGEQLADRRFDVRRFNGVETWQAGKVEQGIGGDGHGVLSGDECGMWNEEFGAYLLELAAAPEKTRGRAKKEGRPKPPWCVD